MIQFVVHGGYGKTATTFLQEEIFSRLDSVLYLGKFHHKPFLSKLDKAFCDVFMPTELDARPRASNSCLTIPVLSEILLSLMQKTEKK